MVGSRQGFQFPSLRLFDCKTAELSKVNLTKFICVCLRLLQVSQVMVGLMVMSYSIPLCYAEITEVVGVAVPWWSGITVRADQTLVSLYWDVTFVHAE